MNDQQNVIYCLGSVEDHLDYQHWLCLHNLNKHLACYFVIAKITQMYIEHKYIKSHEMDSLWGPVRNSGGHIITLFLKYC